MASESQDAKLAFYTELRKIELLSDDEDTNPSSCMRNLSHASHKETPTNVLFSRLTKAKERAVTNLQPHHSSSSHDGANSGLPTIPPGGPLANKVLPREVGTEDVYVSGPKMAGKKRKRDESLSPALEPENRQLFKGLMFYFVPNSNQTESRRSRIDQTRKHGATWAREWSDKITHVIVDDNITYTDVLKELGLGSFPPNIELVREEWPETCLEWNDIFDDPVPSCLLVEGFPGTTEDANRPYKEMDREKSKAFTRGYTDPLKQFPGTDEKGSREDDAEVAVDKTFGGVIDSRESLENPKDPLHDDLEDVIGVVKAVADLVSPLANKTIIDSDQIWPIDPDEEDADLYEDSDKADSDEDERRKERQKKTYRKTPLRVEDFSCMQKHDSSATTGNPNEKTIEILTKMAGYYERIKDPWRTTAYRRAVSALKKQTRKISTKAEALAIPFLGDRLAAKIEEIVFTNRLRRLDYIENDSRDKVLQTFMNVYGAGHSVAQRWMAQGHRTLQDLIDKADLTENQRIGVARYDDFLSRIPRDEVEAHGKFVTDFLHEIDPDVQVTIGGSFRRGKADSGDIDLILTKPETSIDPLRNLLLEVVIPGLFAKGFLKVSLASLSSRHGSKWHGASCLPNLSVWRRIDFLLVPWKERGAAFLCFTGNDIFNRSMRLLASRKGMRLNQRGLFKDVMRGPGRQKLTEGTLVESEDERKIFELLRVPWRPPHHRNC